MNEAVRAFPKPLLNGLTRIKDTGARPFVCKECNRPFARQDSLARHEKLHTRRKSPQYPSYPSPPLSHISQPSIPSRLFSLERNSIDDNLSVHHSAQSQLLPPEVSAQNTGGAQSGPLSADLDFDLVWPDSEDLFETLMSSESANQWQLPLGTLPISTRASTSTFGPTSFSLDKGPSIGAIPSGESHQAVHNVSEMVTALVGLQYLLLGLF